MRLIVLIGLALCALLIGAIVVAAAVAVAVFLIVKNKKKANNAVDNSVSGADERNI